MTLLGHLPFNLQALAAFISGTIAFIYVFRVKSYNRVILMSFVLYGYGNAIIALLAYYQTIGSLIILLFKWLHILFFIGIILGIFISYKLGPEEQKGKVLELLKGLAIIFFVGIIGVSILIFIGEVWDL